MWGLTRDRSKSSVYQVACTLGEWLAEYDVEFYICGGLARMCYGSGELTRDVDVLIPSRSWNHFKRCLPSLPDGSYQCVSDSENRVELQVRNGSSLRVDFILDSVPGFPYVVDSSYPFKILSLDNLVHHYFCLMDSHVLTERQYWHFVSGIQSLMERKKLTTSHSAKLPEEYRDVFCLLLKWSVDEEEDSDFDMHDLMKYIQERGCNWHPSDVNRPSQTL